MATKKKASAKPAPKKPINLVRFGPIVRKDYSDEEMRHNLAKALIYIHDKVPNPSATKFIVKEIRVVYDKDDKEYANPELRDDGRPQVTHRYLRKLWMEWGEGEFDYEKASEMLKEPEEDNRPPRPGGMRGWSNHGVG